MGLFHFFVHKCVFLIPNEYYDLVCQYFFSLRLSNLYEETLLEIGRYKRNIYISETVS